MVLAMVSKMVFVLCLVSSVSASCRFTRNLLSYELVPWFLSTSTKLVPFTGIAIDLSQPMSTPKQKIVSDYLTTNTNSANMSLDQISDMCVLLERQKNFQESARYALAYLRRDKSHTYFNDLCAVNEPLARLLINETIPEADRLKAMAEYLQQSSKSE